MQEFINFLGLHPYLTSAVIAVLVLLTLIEVMRAKQSLSQLSTTAAIQLMNHNNALVIDVRSKETFQQGHIIDAQSMPGLEATTATKKLEKYKTRPLILIANQPREAQSLAMHLQRSGYKAQVLAGGMRAWLDAQLPIVKE